MVLDGAWIYVTKRASLPTNAKMERLENEIDRTINANAPAACYPPDVDFLVRSEKRSEQVLKSYKDFNQLREHFKGEAVTNRYNVVWKELEQDEI